MSVNKGNREQDVGIARRISDLLGHRGPDDHGTWIEPEGRVVLVHRRLSIIDTSSDGSQPMVSPSGRWVMVYNGEIYNHLELRAQLESTGRAPEWRGGSDTESFLACVDAWGVDRALKLTNGMFALALWDRRDRKLWLARDRVGEKPLYYGWRDGCFLFGSELKALRAHPGFSASVDRGALSLLIRHNYIPGPYSIYEGIFKLPAGTWARTSGDASLVTPVAYWSFKETAERGVADQLDVDDDTALGLVSDVLAKAVKDQMQSDVPLGALLSGGIDSSTIVALMQAQSSKPIKTFTIGFDDAAYDESKHARDIAAHLGTNHTEVKLSGENALALISRLPIIYDEPFADSSQLPTLLVSQLASGSVKVALSGDGGDEVFAGYNRYRFVPSAWKIFGGMPFAVRKPAIALATRGAGLLQSRLNVAGINNKIDKLRRLFSGPATSTDDLYVTLVSEWNNPASLVVGGYMPPNILDDRTRWPESLSPVERMMVIDAITYLPDDILVKVDRAAMAFSLETRVPFLDRRVIELAWRLPIQYKLRGGIGKWILRRLLDQHLPRELVERPKQGFGIPLNDWLRGPLREWAEDLLSPDRFARDGYISSAEVRQAWQSHLKGERDCGHRLWSILMFQAWLQSHHGQSH